MTPVILVINKNTGPEPAALLPFKEQYKVFSCPVLAMDHAKSIGWSSQLPSFGLDLTPGMCNLQMHGDVNISIIALELK